MNQSPHDVMKYRELLKPLASELLPILVYRTNILVVDLLPQDYQFYSE